MEKPKLIEAQKEEDEKNMGEEILPEDGQAHTEAVALVEKHRDFFEHYAGGQIKIEPAPAGLKTFAFNLEQNTIYVNSMFFVELGLSEEKTVFASLHEIEHFLEKIQILAEEGGEKKFDRYLKKIKASRAFSLLDNCVADIRENRTVVVKTNQGQNELEQKIYQENLFPTLDFTAQPRHIQFCQALLREARVPDEECLVNDEVRQALREVAKVPELLEIMTNPATSMSLRLRLQDKYLWPKVEALMVKDIEDKKEQPKKKAEGEEKKEDGDKQGESQEGQDGEEENTDGQKGEDGDKSNQGEPKADKGKQSGQNQGGESGDTVGEDESVEQPSVEISTDETDPNKIFANEYIEAEKKFPEAVPIEEIEKAFKEWQEKQKEKISPDRADEEYAQKIGVEKKDLQAYRQIAESLEKIIDPETGVGVMEEMRNLFARIISKRSKPQLAPRYPVAEGDELVDPAQLVADVRAGNLEPKVWEDTEIREKKGDRFGEVEITIVCDRSSSMTEGQKAVEQRKSAVLVMEVLKEFAELCEEEKMNIDKPLSIKSEIYTFASSADDKKPLKKMSAELGEAERINVLKKLYDLPGSTTDFVCLTAINSCLDQETKQKIKAGELKKIVIVFTDGGSDKPAEVQVALKNLRETGLVAIGVGITKSGEAVLSTYAPDALVVEDVSKLPLVLAELLKHHLKDI